MIDSSIFVCFSLSGHNFLGFSRYAKEDKVTPESWEKITCSVVDKVFNPITNRYKICCYYCKPIKFAWDYTELGVSLRRLDPPTLSELSMERVSKAEQTIERNSFLDNLKNDSLCVMKNIDPEQLRQIELNEFAVKTLCEISMQYGIDKQTVLQQLRQVRSEGYLSRNSFDKLQCTISYM